ncbi:MAG: hypothetical protein JW909_04915 [Planctomycetes bacterium]|nr:hypothetical protein [Planctomycetota bacterium]
MKLYGSTTCLAAVVAFGCLVSSAAEDSPEPDPFRWIMARDFEKGTEGYYLKGGSLATVTSDSFSGNSALSIPASFPGSVDVEKMGGIGKVEQVSFGVYVPEDWPLVECVLYVQEKDGLWWQSAPVPLVKKAPRSWNVAAFDIYADLHPVNHGAPLQRWFARDISRIGIRFQCKSRASGSILLDGLRIRRLPPERLEFVSVALDRRPPAVYKPFEADVRLSRDFFNPFDPEEIDVSCEITAPDGAALLQPCYYDQPYLRNRGPEGLDTFVPSGPGRFRLRFSPMAPGRYGLVFVARSGDDTVRSSPYGVDVPDKKWGFTPVRVASDKRSFETVSGEFFYPIGHNLRSPTDSRCTRVLGWDPLPDRGLSAYEHYFGRMRDAGENLAEVWMASWWLGIEWNRNWKGYHGLGWYNLEHAWMLDRVLDEAASNGLYVHLVIDNHGKYSSYCDQEWQYSPFNAGNGGFLHTPDHFFTDARAMELYRRKMRYILARWGAYSNIMGLELISELDLTGSRHGTYRMPYILDWHRSMADYIRKTDIHGHLLTTHFSGDFHVINPNVAGDACIDYVVVDAYRNGVSPFPHTARVSAENLVRYGKPFMVTEYGGAWNGTDELGLEADLHSGLWAFWMTPAAGTPLLWWFDFIERRDLYFHFTALEAFARGEDRRKAASPASYFFSVPGGLEAMFYGDDASGYGWIYDPAEMTYLPAADKRRLRTGVEVRLPAVMNGDFEIEFWDTCAGKVLGAAAVSASAGSGISFTLPDFRSDIALKYRRTAAGKPPAETETSGAETGVTPRPPSTAPQRGDPPPEETRRRRD